MMQPPMTPPGGGGLPPEILQALMAQNPQMGMDPGMAPDAMTPQDEMSMMEAEGMPQSGPPMGDPMASLTSLDPGMQMPSTDPMQIAAVLAEMRAQDEMKMEAEHQMRKMAFMQQADEAAMLAIQAVRELQANSGMTATSPEEGFDSGFGQPSEDLIA